MAIEIRKTSELDPYIEQCVADLNSMSKAEINRLANEAKREISTYIEYGFAREEEE